MSFKLEWENSPQSQFQTIYRANGPFEFDRLPDVYATVEKGVAEFTDTAIEQFTPYFYRVASNRELKSKSEQVVSQLVSAGFMGGPSLNLDFAAQSFAVMQPSGAMSAKPFSDIVTFTRASTGTYFDASGVLQVADANQPRFDHDPITGAPLGILIEEQRTNLLLRSSEFGDGYWTKSGAYVIPNTTVSPDGSVNADSVVTTGVNSTSPSAAVSAITSAGVTYTYSVWMRADTPQTKILQIPVPSFASYLAQKNVTLTTAWQRFDITFTGQAGALWIRSSAIGEAFEIWGAQLEAGAFPTSYIPTEASQVTRAADVASVNTLAPWYNASEGTLVVDAAPITTAGNKVLAALSDGSINNRVELRSNGATNELLVVAASVSQAQVGVSGYAGGQINMAGTFANNMVVAAVNGALSAQDTSSSVPAIDRLTIGSRAPTTGSFLNGHIRSIQYLPRRLTNADLQELSA